MKSNSACISQLHTHFMAIYPCLSQGDIKGNQKTASSAKH